MNQLVTVPFHGDTLFAVHQPDGIFIAIRPIADRLGLDWSGQLKRTKRSTILSKGMAVMTIPSPGGAQEATCLRLDLLTGWLFGIDASRVRLEIRPAVLAYQEECFSVLYKHFFPPQGVGVMSTPSAEPGRGEPTRIRRQLVTEARCTFGHRVAGQLWIALGLPAVPEMRDAIAQGSFNFDLAPSPIPAPAPPDTDPA